MTPTFAIEADEHREFERSRPQTAGRFRGDIFHRNTSRAADKLAMSQPAVSNQLARLRELIGDPLFARGRRGGEPTVKAQAMIGPVREALGLIGRQFGAAIMRMIYNDPNFKGLGGTFEPARFQSAIMT